MSNSGKGIYKAWRHKDTVSLQWGSGRLHSVKKMFCLELAPTIFNQGYPYDQHIHLKKTSEIHQREVTCHLVYGPGWRLHKGIQTLNYPLSLRQNFIFLCFSLWSPLTENTSMFSFLNNIQPHSLLHLSNEQISDKTLQFKTHLPGTWIKPDDLKGHITLLSFKPSVPRGHFSLGPTPSPSLALKTQAGWKRATPAYYPL